jgi:hypothetical protein
MTCFKIDMLISNLLHFVLKRRDVPFQRFRRTAVVGHSTHDPGCFDGQPSLSLIIVAQEISVSALYISIDRHKLSQQFHVSPMNIVFLQLTKILLSLLVTV